MKVIFFGSSSYCLSIASALQSHFELAAIITKPKSVVRQFALKNNISCYTPQNKAGLLALKEKLINLRPDLGLVADFGLIIPKEIFTVPANKTLNVHFSKLPSLRGASPVQYTILLGEKNAWITIILMDEGLDTGAILWQKEVPIEGHETSEVLYNKLFNIVSLDLPDVIKRFALGKIKPLKQNHGQATYTKVLTRSDGFIPWHVLHSALTGTKVLRETKMTWPLYNEISRQFMIPQSSVSNLISSASRALSPWPSLWTKLKINNQEKRLKLLNLHEKNNKIIIDRVQLEGKNPVSWKQFLEGHPALFR